MSSDDDKTAAPGTVERSGDNAEVTESTESVGVERTDEPAAEAGREGSGVVGRLRRHAVAILLVAALVLSGGLAGWLYFAQYRADQQTDQAARDAALEAAKTGTVALLSYTPETLDEDFQTAKSHLTGEFLDYYTEFTETVVAPAATQKSVNTEAKIMLGAVSDLGPEAAEVLLFINQTTMSQENPDGAFAASSVKVGLKKIDGDWLIASFDPV